MTALYSILQNDAEALSDSHARTFERGASVLITGASGIIGINMVAFFCTEKLISRDIKIYLAINKKESKNFINSIFPNIKITFVDLKLSELSPVLVNSMKFDYIFHLATYGQPGKFTSESLETMKLNSIGVIKLFELLNPKGKFFFSSSSEIYSGNTSVPHKEEDLGRTSTTHPRACYIEAKRFGETYCHIKSQNGISAYSGRISLSYGPGFRIGDERVLNEFIVKAITNKTIYMKDQGSAVRVYCYVSDTIDMIFRLIGTNHFRPINIGGMNKISIYQLALEIGKQSGAEVKRGPALQGIVGAPETVFSSQSLALKILEKRNYITVDKGILRTIKWARAMKSFISNKKL